MPGGTAFYFAHALAGLPVRCKLVTAVAPAEMQVAKNLQARGVDVTVLPSAHSVVFENRYSASQEQRTQKVLQKAAPFRHGLFAGVDATVFHLGPLLADDFTVSDIKALAARGRLSLDVQGFLRSVKDTAVVPADWLQKTAVLPFIHYLKASEEEMTVLTGATNLQHGAKMLAGWGAKEVIVTCGSKGSLVYDGSRFYTIPAYTPECLKDATGCGDTYMAGYLFQRCHGASIVQAGKFAAAMATLKIGVSGPFTGTAADVEAVMKNKEQGNGKNAES